MPVQTRKRPATSAETNPAAKSPKRPKANGGLKQSSADMDVDHKEPKDQFLQVVNEIDRSSKVLQSKLSKPSASASQLQDPKKAPLRKAVVDEVRRLSEPLADDFAKPREVKAKVSAEETRKAAGAKLVQKAVVRELDGLEDASSQLLHPIRGRAGKPVKRGKKMTVAQAKAVQKKTMQELEELVTPNVAYRPQLVMGKLSQRSAKVVLGQEVKKAVVVKDIKRLGVDGVTAQLKHTVKAQAATSPKKKSPKKK